MSSTSSVKSDNSAKSGKSGKSATSKSDGNNNTLAAKRRRKKKALNIKINPNLIYAERNHWALTFRPWTRYKVLAPRLSNQLDGITRWVDNSKQIPVDFKGFIGDHNKPVIESLNKVFGFFEVHKTFPEVLIMSGPSGSGKTALTKVFAQMLQGDMDLTDQQASKWMLQEDAKTYKDDFKPLWAKITKFMEPVLEKAIQTKYRVVVIDNMSLVPPSNQQFLKTVMENAGASTSEPRLRYIFVCNKPQTELIGYISSKATTVRTNKIAERDALMIMIFLCYKMRIGYEAEGMKALFTLNPDNSLSNLIDMVQKVFNSTSYISHENVMKNSSSKAIPQLIPPERAMEPLERCTICTLYPPCKHTPYEKLVQMGIKRRRELPRYKQGSMACPDFVLHGYCKLFNKYGHCSLDHPKNLHKLEVPRKYCGQCTIPWPCNHCAYTQDRKRLQATCDEMQRRLTLLKQINVPDPPMSLTRHLFADYPVWRETVAEINSHCNIPKNLELLKRINEWNETKYSINIPEYIDREKQLHWDFGELWTTAILAPKPERGPNDLGTPYSPTASPLAGTTPAVTRPGSASALGGGLKG